MTQTSSDTATTLITLNPTSQLPIKLTSSGNFLTWQAKTTTLLLGYDLMSYVDSTFPCPSPFITDNNKQIANPSYKSWQRQDNLLRNAIMAFVDPCIASLVAFATTSKQAWQRLVTTYSNKFQARIYGLRENLTHVMKGTKSIAQYLSEIQFKEISAAIRARDHPITYEELYDKLSAREIFLTHEALKKDAQTISVHYTQHGQQNSNSNRSFNGNKATFNNNRKNGGTNGDQYSPPPLVDALSDVPTVPPVISNPSQDELSLLSQSQLSPPQHVSAPPSTSHEFTLALNISPPATSSTEVSLPHPKPPHIIT
ncbi:hypothetical protein GH714_023238 [Hevea brasiliensis]|uniref:Retrotransposon Copia-like N-terminal domain-containing protein n=1 Tax=Hevea brasiliensis TaxID=3981 RepID=A0A6A6KCQ9_HEVBR|nr:hypothetical protein GH714_023238 [Hevea brasiliensis]